MHVEEEKIYSLKETAALLQVSTSTLREWDNKKTFVAMRTDGKHRRYLGKNIMAKYQEMLSGGGK